MSISHSFHVSFPPRWEQLTTGSTWQQWSFVRFFAIYRVHISANMSMSFHVLIRVFFDQSVLAREALSSSCPVRAFLVQVEYLVSSFLVCLILRSWQSNETTNKTDSCRVKWKFVLVERWDQRLHLPPIVRFSLLLLLDFRCVLFSCWLTRPANSFVCYWSHLTTMNMTTNLTSFLFVLSCFILLQMDKPICKKKGGNSTMDGDPDNSNLSQFFFKFKWNSRKCF